MLGFVDPSFWNARRVLVTGNTGFKGAWLSLWLEKLGAKLHGYALSPPETQPSLFAAANIEKIIDTDFADVRDLDCLERVFSQFEPEIVFHLAAQALVRRSYKYPVETYATNVMGTVHVLEALRKTPSVKAAVIVTSDKCYENHECLSGYKESDRLGGFDPYSSSKACAELVSSAYRSSFCTGDSDSRPPLIATARAGNVIGGGDWSEDRIVPDIVRSLSSSIPLLIRNKEAIRPWQHVLEPLSGYLMLAQRLYQNEAAMADAWNFGPDADAEKSVEWLVSRFLQLWGVSHQWITDPSPSPKETRCLKLDSSRVRTQLGWKPRWSIEETVEMTVEWYKKYKEFPSTIMDLSLAQIEAYTM